MFLRHLGLSDFNLWEILLNYFVHHFSPFVFLEFVLFKSWPRDPSAPFRKKSFIPFLYTVFGCLVSTKILLGSGACGFFSTGPASTVMCGLLGSSCRVLHWVGCPGFPGVSRHSQWVPALGAGVPDNVKTGHSICDHGLGRLWNPHLRHTEQGVGSGSG